METQNIEKTPLTNDVVDAITNTINDCNCEDDAKQAVRTMLNMYATIKVMDYIIETKQGEIK